MDRLTSALSLSILLGAGLSVIGGLPAEATQRLQGSWDATNSERDGKAAGELVGHRLTFTGRKFLIRSKSGERLYAGTARTSSNVRPAAIDFTHQEGDLKGKVWKGIYALDRNKLIICDNAPDLEKVRPASFDECGSGYVLVTFERRR
jgi:uncharacterized protein (TIGR03067 family)